MEPVSVWVRKNGEWAIIHRCKMCGSFSSNRTAADDNPMKLMSIAMRPISQPPFPIERIEEMTRSRTVEGNNFRGMEYGYLWWIIDRKKNIYAAIGNSGNVIYVNPEKNIVIAVSSYFKPTIFDRVDFIQEYIEPFISEI